MHKAIGTVAKATLILSLLAALPACTPAYVPTSSEVAQAYNSSGLISVPPYTRTIFSSSNF